MGEDIWHLISRLVAIETFPVCVGVVIHRGDYDYKYKPQVNLSTRGEEREYFCGAILYMVREFGFHPLRPKDYDYEYKVTFLQGSLEKVGTKQNGQFVTLCLRATPYGSEVKVPCLVRIWKNAPM